MDLTVISLQNLTCDSLKNLKKKYFFKKKNLNYCERLRYLNLIPLNYYILLTDLLLLPKLVNNYYAFRITEHINIVQRRSSFWFVLPEIKTEFQRSNFFYRTTYRANIIDSNVKFFMLNSLTVASHY